MGAVGLHDGDPRRKGGGAGRTERRRQDDAAPPRGRTARTHVGHDLGAGWPARRRSRHSSVASGSSPRTRRPTRSLSVADHLPLRRVAEPGAGTRSWPSSGSTVSVSTGQQRTGRLSGGQRAQLALTARRSPSARSSWSSTSRSPASTRSPGATSSSGLADVVADQGVSVVLSSHLVADLEQVCDHLVVLVGSRVQVAGDIDELVASHGMATRGAGPHVHGARWPRAGGGGVMIRLALRQFRTQAVVAAGGAARRASPSWPSPDPHLVDVYDSTVANCAETRHVRQSAISAFLETDRIASRLARHPRDRGPGPDRRLLGRAARRPRDRARHLPPRVDPERDPHPLAGRASSSWSASRAMVDRGPAQPDGHVVGEPATTGPARRRSRPVRPARPRADRPCPRSRSCSASPWA